MNSRDALHCSLCRIVEMGKCSRRRRRRRRGRAGYPAGGDVWLMFEMTEAGGELRELLVLIVHFAE
jgi:hypothetical protein